MSTQGRDRLHAALTALRRLWEEAGRRPRLLYALGLAASLWLALAPSHFVLSMAPDAVEAELRRPGDMRNLYFAATQAHWSDLPKWWTGPWIYPDVGYYRPLTSMLYLWEQRTFDRNFTAYNRITWCAHGLNAILLFALTASLFAGRPRLRALCGLVAAQQFCALTGPMGFGVIRALTWWPAQNDVFSLTFGLLCLLLLETYLQRPRPLPLLGALLSLAASVWFKEMGYIAVPVGLLLILRRHRGSLRAALPPLIALVVAAASLWLLRRLAVPHPWGPVMLRAVILQKAFLHWGGPIYRMGRAGVWWPLAASASILAIVVIGNRLRTPHRVVGIVCLVATALCAQFIGEGATWALLLMPEEVGRVVEILLYVLTYVLAWRYRRVEPVLVALIAYLLVFVPILQYGGAHYFYWPAAFLGLLNGAFLACVVRAGREVYPTLQGRGKREEGRETAATSH